MTAPPSLPHSRAFELLPWLVNGTLAGAERAAVETHTRTCMVCRRELREQQRLHAEVRGRASADISAEAGLELLDRKLDGTTQAGRSGYLAFARFAVAAAAGITVLAVLVWFTPLPDIGAPYTTLATPPTSDAVLLDIVFAENTTAAEMQALLDGVDAEIVAGPGKLGRYSIRVAGDGPDGTRLREMLRTISADPHVRFVGRAFTESP